MSAGSQGNQGKAEIGGVGTSVPQCIAATVTLIPRSPGDPRQGPRRSILSLVITVIQEMIPHYRGLGPGGWHCREAGRHGPYPGLRGVIHNHHNTRSIGGAVGQ